MRYYPINLDIAGKNCIVIGGGAVGERKVLTLLEAGAVVTVISPELTDGLRALVADGKAAWRQAKWQSGDLAGSFLVICATDDETVNAAAAAEARRTGALVNVVDTPALCDFTLPALISRGDLLLTVSTGGSSPILARRIREEIAGLYSEDFGIYLEEIGTIRNQMKNCLATPAERERFWRAALDADVLALVRRGNMREAKEKIIRAASCAGTES